MISTKGRYALRIMLDFAQLGTDHYVPMKEVARRQDISLKYIEQIMPLLTRRRLLEGVHGKGGGYRLCRPADTYTVWDILTAAEGDMAPVSCLKEDAPPCSRCADCQTLSVWSGYYRLTKDYFSGIKLTDLLDVPSGGDYSI